MVAVVDNDRINSEIERGTPPALAPAAASSGLSHPEDLFNQGKDLLMKILKGGLKVTLRLFSEVTRQLESCRLQTVLEALS